MYIIKTSNFIPNLTQSLHLWFGFFWWSTLCVLHGGLGVLDGLTGVALEVEYDGGVVRGGHGALLGHILPLRCLLSDYRIRLSVLNHPQELLPHCLLPLHHLPHQPLEETPHLLPRRCLARHRFLPASFPSSVSSSDSFSSSSDVKKLTPINTAIADGGTRETSGTVQVSPPTLGSPPQPRWACWRAPWWIRTTSRCRRRLCWCGEPRARRKSGTCCRLGGRANLLHHHRAARVRVMRKDDGTMGGRVVKQARS